MGESMNKKLGPLKTWQWGVLAGGLLLAYYLYERKKGSSTETKEEPASETFASTPQTLTGTSGSGEGSGGGGSSTPASPPASAEQPTPGPAAQATPEAASPAQLPAASGENTSPVIHAKPVTASPHGKIAGTKHIVNAQGEHFTVNTYGKGIREVFQTAAEKAADAGEKARAARQKSNATHAKAGAHVPQVIAKHPQRITGSPHSGATAAVKAQKKRAKPAAKHSSAHKIRAR